MKKVILCIAVITAMGLTSCNSQTKKEKETTKTETTKTEISKNMAMTDLSFGVRGNCGMCKKTIEKATYSVEGVTSANWNVDEKKIDVSFDNKKTNTMAIHKAIADSGYDTEKVEGNLIAYDNLPGCCQYDHTMEINQGEAKKSNTKEEHKH